MLQPKLAHVEPMSHLKLKLTYETGEVKMFDVSPYANGAWFGELKEDTYFQTVRMLPDGAGIEWCNGQDIAPHELYECSISIYHHHKRLLSNGEQFFRIKCRKVPVTFRHFP